MGISIGDLTNRHVCLVNGIGREQLKGISFAYGPISTSVVPPSCDDSLVKQAFGWEGKNRLAYYWIERRLVNIAEYGSGIVIICFKLACQNCGEFY